MQVPTSTIAIIVTLAALLSSIFTVAIGKILDLIQKRQEHKYSLQKAFFEKKLKVAEALVIYSRKTMEIVGPLTVLFKRIPQFALMPSGQINMLDFLNSETQRISSQLKTFAQETHDSVYAAALYFDTPMPNPDTAYERVLTSFMKLAFVINKFSLLKNADGTFRFSTPVATGSPEEAELLKILKELTQAMTDFTSTIDALKNETDNFIRYVRDEMKRYEPQK